MTVFSKQGKKVCNIKIDVYNNPFFKVNFELFSNEHEIIDIDIASFDVRSTLIVIPTLFSTKQMLGVRLIQRGEEICSIVMNQDQIDILKNAIQEIKEQKRCLNIYNNAISLYKSSSSIADKERAIQLLSEITDFRDTDQIILNLKEDIYQHAINTLSNATIPSEAEDALYLFTYLEGYKDSKEQVDLCHERLKQLNISEQKYQLAKSKIKLAKTIDEIDEVINQFVSLNNYKDSSRLVDRCKEIKTNFMETYYLCACSDIEQITLPEHILPILEIFTQLGEYKDSESKVKQCLEIKEQLENKELLFQEALSMFQNAQTIQQYKKCLDIFASIGAYRDSDIIVLQIKEHIDELKLKLSQGVRQLLSIRVEALYQDAIHLYENAMIPLEAESAMKSFLILKDYKDSKEKVEQCRLQLEFLNQKEKLYQETINSFQYAQSIKQLENVRKSFLSLDNYRDSQVMLKIASEKQATIQTFVYQSVLQLLYIRLEAQYQNAVHIYSSAQITEDANVALRLFTELGNYKDSSEREKFCHTLISELDNREKDYQDALFTLSNAQSIFDLEKAHIVFTLLDNYKDSKNKAKLCRKFKKELESKKEIYEKAISIIHHAKYVRQFEEAYKYFSSLGDYKKSKELATYALNAIEHLRDAISQIEITIKEDDYSIDPMLPHFSEADSETSVISNIRDNRKSFFQLAREYANYEGLKVQYTPFFCYWPKYSDMNDEQLKWYFYWRSLVRSEIYPETDISYIFVYVYELLNQIGTNTIEQSFNILLDLWTHYSEKHPKLKKYLYNWIFDLSQVYHLDFPSKKLLWQSDHASTQILNYTLTDYYNKKEPFFLPVWALEILSYYKISERDFYQQKNKELINDILPKAVMAVDQYLRESHNEGILDTCIENDIYTDNIVAFSSALIEFPVTYELSCKNFTYGLKLENFLNNLIKYIENDLRLYRNYSNRITNIILPDYIKTVVDNYLSKELSFPFAEKNKQYSESINLDINSINNLRKESNQVRDTLIASMQEDISSEHIYDDIQQTSEAQLEYTKTETQYDWGSFFDRIKDKYGLDLLSALLDGVDSFTIYAKKHNHIPELLLDDINEIASDTVGDLVVNQNGILDEYLSIIKNYIK